MNNLALKRKRLIIGSVIAVVTLAALVFAINLDHGNIRNWQIALVPILAAIYGTWCLFVP